MEFATRSKRMLAFFLDRLYIFPLVILTMYLTNYQALVDKLIDYAVDQQFIDMTRQVVIVVFVAYGWVLFYYFIFFVVIQYFTKFTLGKYICKIQLMQYEKDNSNSVPSYPTFFYLVKRFFLLYVFGVGSMGYFYIITKDKEAPYDTNINSFVFDIKK